VGSGREAWCAGSPGRDRREREAEGRTDTRTAGRIRPELCGGGRRMTARAVPEAMPEQVQAAVTEPDRENDLTRAMGLLKAVSESSPEWMSCITIAGKPHSKARPRFTRNGHTY